MKIDYCNLYIRFSTRKIWCLLHSKNSHVGHSNLIHGSTQIRHVGLNSWIFRKIFEFQTWYIYFWQRLLYLCILKSRPLDLFGGGGVQAHMSHPPSQRACSWHQLWKLNSSRIGGRQVLNHNCSIPAPCFFQIVKLLVL